MAEEGVRVLEDAPTSPRLTAFTPEGLALQASGRTGLGWLHREKEMQPLLVHMWM